MHRFSFVASVSTTDMSSVYQDFIDEKIKAGLAPGLSAVVFDRNGLIFSGTSGVVSAKSRGWYSTMILTFDPAAHDCRSRYRSKADETRDYSLGGILHKGGL